MGKYKIKMAISTVITIILIMHILTPLFSIAKEEQELTIQHTQIEIEGGYNINIIASSPSKILAASYVPVRKTISDFNTNAEAIINYFENVEGTKIKITTDNYIDETIFAKQIGVYTVYLRNSDGEIMLYPIKMEDKSIEIVATSQENENSKSILIEATSKSNIKLVKVIKAESATTEDFMNVSNLLQSEAPTVQIEYPIIENGKYFILVKNETGYLKMMSLNVKVTQEIDDTVPEQSIKFYRYKDLANKIYADLVDSKNNINFVKYKISDIEISKDDVKENGTQINVAEKQNLTVEITNSDIADNKYFTLYFRDSAGYGIMKEILISNIEVIEQPATPVEIEEQEPATPVEVQEQEPATPVEIEEQEPVVNENQTDGSLVIPIEQDISSETKKEEISEIPEIPEIPEISENQEVSQKQENSENQENPENQKNSEKLETPEIKENSENSEIQEIQEIKEDNTVINNKNSQETEKEPINIQEVLKDDTKSPEKYSQTGSNNGIIICGIIISSIVTIISYVQMKREKNI